VGGPPPVGLLVPFREHALTDDVSRPKWMSWQMSLLSEARQAKPVGA